MQMVQMQLTLTEVQMMLHLKRKSVQKVLSLAGQQVQGVITSEKGHQIHVQGKNLFYIQAEKLLQIKFKVEPLYGVLSNKKKLQLAAPTKLTKADPIVDAFKAIANREDLEVSFKPDSDEEHKNKKSSCVSKEELDTPEGTVQVKQYALKRRQKKVKTFHCSTDGCV